MLGRSKLGRNSDGKGVSAPSGALKTTWNEILDKNGTVIAHGSDCGLFLSPKERSKQMNVTKQTD